MYSQQYGKNFKDKGCFSFQDFLYLTAFYVLGQPEMKQFLSHDSNIWVTVFSDDVQLTFCFQLDSTLIHNMFAQWHMFC